VQTRLQNESIMQQIFFQIFILENLIIFIFPYIPRYHSPPKQVFVMIESTYSAAFLNKEISNNYIFNFN